MTKIRPKSSILNKQNNRLDTFLDEEMESKQVSMHAHSSHIELRFRRSEFQLY